jgi:hypothetical protein
VKPPPDHLGVAAQSASSVKKESISSLHFCGSTEASQSFEGKFAGMHERRRDEIILAAENAGRASA